MGNCLKTQLKEVVNNQDLKVIDTIKLTFDGSIGSSQTSIGEFRVMADSPLELQILSGTIYSDAEASTPITQPSITSTYIHFYNKENVPAVVRVMEKQKITSFGISANNGFSVDFDDLMFLSNCNVVTLTGIKTSGSLERLFENYSVFNNIDEIYVSSNYSANTEVTFNNTVVRRAFYYVRNKSTNIVTIYGTKTGDIYSDQLATYNMVTKQWTYNS